MAERALILSGDAWEMPDEKTGEVRSGDLVLVKASRGIGLEKVVQRLLGDACDGGGEGAH